MKITKKLLHEEKLLFKKAYIYNLQSLWLFEGSILCNEIFSLSDEDVLIILIVWHMIILKSLCIKKRREKEKDKKT